MARHHADKADSKAAGSRAEAAHRRILALISEGALGQGDRLPSETEMALSFGISRPVIRQALARLQQAGIVDVRWGAGSYVRGPGKTTPEAPTFGPLRGLNEIAYTFELRMGIECEAAALAAARGPSPERREIRAALERLDTAVATVTVGQDADLDFHFAIAAATGNPFYERVMGVLRPPLEFCIGLARTLSLTHPHERVRVVQAEHEAVCEAIEANAAERARAAMRLHLQYGLRRIYQGPGLNL